jgi:hypothetical protein
MPEQEEGVDPSNLSAVAAARYEAQTFLNLHPEFFTTPANGKMITDYMAEKNLKLNANNFEYAFERLKAQGKLLPGKETLALMGSEEFKQFAKTHGTPVRDEFGRVSYELPDAYLTESTEDYRRPRQSSSLQPVADQFPEDKNKTFTAKQLAGFSADRYRAYCERIGTWGK